MELLAKFVSRAIDARWRDVPKFLLAYVILRTGYLKELSERGSAAQRLELTALLFAFASGLLAAFAWLRGGEGATVNSMARVQLVNFAEMAVVLVPFFIAYWLIRRVPPHFVANVILAQLILLSFGVALHPLVTNSMEPARTEFEMYRDGNGAGTLPHQRNCGALQRQAEQLAATDSFVRLNFRRLAELKRLQEAQPTDPAAEEKLAEERSALTRQKASLDAEADRLAQRLKASVAEGARIEALYRKRYPSERAADRLLFLFEWLPALLTLLHLARGVFFSRGATATANVAGLLISLAASVGVLLVLERASNYRTLGDLDLTSQQVQLMNSKDPTVALAEWDDLFAGSRTQLLNIALKLKPQCGAPPALK